jgi:hypothetical protein
MSADLLFADLLREVDRRIKAALRSWRPDLSKTTGVLPGYALPVSGPAAPGGTGTGYPPADTSVTTGKIDDDAVTFAKMQNIATDRLIGRDTAGTGDPEALTVGGGVEFTSSGGIQRSALTGDVTASAGSGSTTIANDAVTYAKMQNVSAASKLIGRGDGGSGDPQEITLGSGLTMTGTTLDATGGGSGAPTTATYITQTHDATLSAEQALGDLATGLLKNTTGTGVLSVATAGTDYAAASHDHTGTGDGGKLTAPVLDSYAVLEEIAAPSSPAADTVRLYAKDKGGITELFYKASDGTERDLSDASSTGANTTSTGAAGSEPGSPSSGNLYFPNNGFSVERYSGSAWAPWGPIFPLTAPVDGDFAWVNQGGASVTTTNGGIALRAPATSGTSFRIRKKSAPATPYTITAWFLMNIVGTQLGMAGLLFRQSSDGKLHAHYLWGNSSGILNLFSTKWTNETTLSAHYVASIPFAPQSPVCLRIADNGTNRICSVSADGVNFITTHTVGRTDFLTANEVGFFANTQSTAFDAVSTLLSWKEA